MCCEKIGKIILIIINVVFFVGGGVLLALGIIALVKVDLLYTITGLLTDNLGGVFEQLDILTQIDLEGLIATNAYILVAIGAVLFALGFLGMCGACKLSKTLLNIYGSIVFVLLLAQVGLGVYAYMYSEKFEAKLQDGIRYGMYKFYKNGYRLNTTDMLGASAEGPELAVDILQVELRCCGVTNSSEWLDVAAGWNRNYTKPDGTMFVPEAQLPPSCCTLMDGTAESIKEAAYMRVPITDFVNLKVCMETGNTDYHETGCYDRLYEIIKDNEDIVIAVMAIIVLVQIVAVACACYLKDKSK